MKLISIETQIIKATIDTLLEKGYLLSVNDGEEITISRSDDPDRIFAAMKTIDEDYLMVRTPMFGVNNNDAHGWVRFIYGNGNEGLDVISDYTVNLEPIMVKITEMINEYEAR